MFIYTYIGMYTNKKYTQTHTPLCIHTKKSKWNLLDCRREDYGKTL